MNTILSRIDIIGSNDYFNNISKENDLYEFEQIANTLDKASKKLFESSQKFQTLFEESLDGIVLMNPKTQKFIEFNRHAYEMYGYTKEEFSLLTPMTLDALHDEKQVLATQQAIIEKGWDKFTTKHKTKNGNLKDIRVSVRAMKLNDNFVLHATFHDITEQKIVEQKLLEHSKELQTIFDFAQDGIAITDLNTNFITFNNAYLKQTGYEREELLKLSCISLTAPENRAKSLEMIQKVMQDGFVSGFEKKCIKKDGTNLIVNMSIALMPDRKRLLVTTKNITENKHFEEQSKLASMGEMIGNIAHQWRQPLSVISTIASGVSFKEEFNNLSHENIISEMDAIVNQTIYLSKTIDDFRNFIKSSGEESTININSLIDKTLSIITPTLKNNYIEIVFDVEEDIKICGFQNELMQVFINLVNNSKDAMNQKLSQEDDRYIFITIHKINNIIEIIFKDNAKGIDKTVIERIFEPYFTTKHQSVGTGLGLSMAYKIITERHQGTIEATNTTYTYNGKDYTGAMFKISFNASEEEML
jgi:PAS domain S-box-containing protein